MSLYRTWRPKSFSELVGQDAVVRTLRTALASGKLAHAYLFSGPRGSGKTSAAKILSRCIDCVHGPTPDPDNTCEYCLAILNGTALDVLEIDAASNRGIDEIRALRESVKFAPASMRYKVFIIDEAHMLTREGANAFLKTLEEPPPHAIFILATTAPEALPPTILSRCQRYAFRRIPIAVMIERMRTIAAAEQIAIDDGALAAIAYRADGGLRDALTMLEQVAAFAGGPIEASTVDAAFGTTGREHARRLVAAILAGDAALGLRVVDEASDGGADMLGLIRGAIGEYRNLLVARIDPELLRRDLSQSDAEAARELAAATPQPKVVRGLRLLADSLAAGRLSGNPRLELETALLRLVVQHEDPSLEALATRVALLEQGASPAAQSRPAAARAAQPAVRKAAPADSSPPAASPAAITLPRAAAAPLPAALPSQEDAPPVAVPAARQAAPPAAEDAAAGEPGPPVTPGAKPTLQQIRSLWDQIRLRAEERQKPLRAPLSRATVDALEGDVLRIGVVDSVQEELLRAKAAVLESVLADVLRVPLRVTFSSGGRGSRTSAHRSTRRDPEVADASAGRDDGEDDLLAYARKKLGSPASGSETR
ncbi:MAG: DNA polymerase III subunit gamma/tau [Vulcanimicrobiaceae bacterium]